MAVFEDLAKLMNDANAAQKTDIRAAAEAERNYRLERAKKWVEAKTKEGMLAKEKEDWINSETAELRYARDIASGMIGAYAQEQQNLRQQMSLIQSQMKSEQSELDAYKYRQNSEG